MTTWRIRPAGTADLSLLADVERDATRTLLDALGESEDDPGVTPRELLEGSMASGLLLVATDGADIPVGFVAADQRDGLLYVGEIDVRQSWQRRGIGRALMLASLAEGRRRNWPGAMLTTDRHVPFNAPFYATLGFRMVEDAELPAALAAVIARERAVETGPSRRVAMRLDFADVSAERVTLPETAPPAP